MFIRFLVFLMMIGLGSVEVWGGDYVFMYVNNNTYNILKNNGGTIANSQNRFDQNTCVWSGTSGSTFSNNNRYLYISGSTLSLSTSSTNLTIDENKIRATSSHKTVAWVFPYYYYLVYDGSWKLQEGGTIATAPGEVANIVFTYSKVQEGTISDNPSISGELDSFNELNNATFSSTKPTYRPTYYKLTQNSGSTYYSVKTDGVTFAKDAEPTNVETVISWSFDDGTLDNGHVRIDATSGQVTYYNWYTSNTIVKIKATATSSEGQTKTATKEITFLPTDYYAKVTAAATTGGSATVDGSSTSTNTAHAPNDPLTFSVKASNTNSSHRFNGWTSTGGGSFADASLSETTFTANASSTVKGTAEYTVTANFVTYKAKVTATATNGTATVDGNSEQTKSTATSGSSLTFNISATPASSDYYFTGWTSSPGTSTGNCSFGSTTDASTTFTAKASSTDNGTANYTITANFALLPDPTSFTVSPASMELKQKQSSKITVSFNTDKCYKNIEFSSSNSGIATVTSEGVVRGVAHGSATITVTAKGRSGAVVDTKTVSVTVTKEVAQNQIGLNFNEGTTPGSLSCFDAFTISDMQLTVSNCLIMPGRHDGTRKDPDGNVIVDFKGTLLEGGKSVKQELTGNQQLDCETFYFDTFDQTKLNNGTLWAYTFTGWHITNTPATGAKIPAIARGWKYPGQTVFQPGDVITPEVLSDYGLLDSEGNVVAGASLTFEALWGKVCFAMDSGDDNNTGNDWTKPKHSFNPAVKAVSVSNDTYEEVVMLTEDLYAINKDGGSYYALTYWIPEIDGEKYSRGITYKSLQRGAEGKRYILYTDNSGIQPEVRGAWRLDNVKAACYNGTFAFQNTGRVDYIETTARYSGTLGLFIRLNSTDAEHVCVFNGGTIPSSETFNWSRKKEDGTSSIVTNFDWRYFYFGRNVEFTGNFYLSSSGTYSECTGPCYLTVTGGYLNQISGTNEVSHKMHGNRYFYIYGDKSGNQEYDPLIGLLRPAGDAALDGDTYVTIAGTTKMQDVYGGGYTYTATVKNATLKINESIINGSVFGGGCFGTTSDTVTLSINKSEIKGNVYGSGKGATSVVEGQVEFSSYSTTVASSQEKFPYYGTEGGATYKATYPVTAPNYTPSYNSTEYSVMGYELVWFSVWGGDPASSFINRNITSYTSSLSMAEAGYTIIDIANSTIGSSTGQGSKSSGNVYGGGSIAKVRNDASITISNSTIWSSVYGGGDGETRPDPVRICPKVSETSFTFEAPTPDAARQSADQSSYQRPNPTDDPTYGEDYIWSSEQKVLSAGGIYKNGNERLVYSPNTIGWGDVNGKTTVSVTGGSTVHGNVYGGGNAGKVGTDTNASSNTTQTTIENSTVNGDVFGACSNAKMSGSTRVKILGASVINGNVYGGGNAGEVTGKTYVQIGEE